jgi:hypothetical protein
MTAGRIERDPLVADALGAIEVPDHAPGFWERLDAATAPEALDVTAPEALDVTAPEALDVTAPAALDVTAPEAPDAATAPEAVDAATAPGAPDVPSTVFLDEPAEVAPTAVPDITLEPEAPSGSWRRRWARGAARVLVAAATVLVFVVAGVVLARDVGDVGPDLSDQTTATTEPGSTTTTAAAPGLVAEEQVVVDFVDALGRGDIDRAAALLGPRSEQYLVAQSGSVDAFLGEAAEGYGAWSTSTDRHVTLVDGIDVVLLEGTVSVEGASEYRRLAMPIAHAESADAWFVDPWAFDPQVDDQRFDFRSPPAGPFGLVLAPGDDLEVSFPAKGTIWISLGGEVASDFSASGAVGSFATWTVPADAADGSTVVVAFQADSGATFIAQALPVAAG